MNVDWLKALFVFAQVCNIKYDRREMVSNLLTALPMLMYKKRAFNIHWVLFISKNVELRGQKEMKAIKEQVIKKVTLKSCF